MSSRKGKIQTVLGLIDPSELGVTLTHEHISMTFECSYTAPPTGDEARSKDPFSLENSGWIQQYPYSHWDNLVLTDQEENIVGELRTFKRNGGSCIVENSTFGLNRSIKFIPEASKLSGVHIVAGAGYYVDASLPAEVKSSSLERLVHDIRIDITDGVADTGIKLGVIGEIGCSWPLTDVERKVLEASANVNSDLGAPLIIHPGRNPAAPAEIVRIMQEYGADISKIVMSHLDRTFTTDEELLEFAKLGTYLEYDLFGIEKALYTQNTAVHMPNDGERIRRIKVLCDHGYLDKILVAHDIHTKHRLVKYGGHGFSHISTVVVPMMRTYGFTDDMINTILVENPRRWLTFTK